MKRSSLLGKILSLVLVFALTITTVLAANTSSVFARPGSRPGQGGSGYSHIDVRVDGTMTYDVQVNGVSKEGYPVTYVSQVTSVTGTVNGKTVSFKQQNSSGENEFRTSGSFNVTDTVSLVIKGDLYEEQTTTKITYEKVWVWDGFLRGHCETVEKTVESTELVKVDEFTYVHTFTQAELQAALNQCIADHGNVDPGFDIILKGEDITNEIFNTVTVHYYADGTTNKVGDDDTFTAEVGKTHDFTAPSISGTVAGIEEGHYTLSSDDVELVGNDFTVTVGNGDSEVIIYYVPEEKVTTTVNYYVNGALLDSDSVTTYAGETVEFDVVKPSDYRVEAYDVTGITLSDVNAGSFEVVANGQTINVYYIERDKYQATINYYVQTWDVENSVYNDKKFIDSVSSVENYADLEVVIDVLDTGYTADDYTIKSDIEGYGFDTEEVTVKISKTNNVYNVTFIEIPKYTVTVNYKFVTDEGKTEELGTKTSEAAQVGETAEVAVILPSDVYSYSTSADDALTLNGKVYEAEVVEKNASYDVVYTEDKKYEVTFNFYKEVIDENGDSTYELYGKKTTGKYYAGKTVGIATIGAPDSNYEYAGTTATETETGFSAVVSSDVTKNVYDVKYDLKRFDVTVHYYVDGTTDKVAEDDKFTAIIDVEYDLTAPVITGTVAGIDEGHYTITSDDVELDGNDFTVVATGNKEIIIYYVPEEKVTTTVNFYKGTELIDTDSIDAYAGDEITFDVVKPSDYRVEAYSVTGITLSDVNTGSFDVIANGQTINVIYTERPKYQATIDYYVKTWDVENSEYNEPEYIDTVKSDATYAGLEATIDVLDTEYTADDFTIESDIEGYGFDTTEVTVKLDKENNSYEVVFVEIPKYTVTVEYSIVTDDGKTVDLGSKTSDAAKVDETVELDIILPSSEYRYSVSSVDEELTLSGNVYEATVTDSNAVYKVVYAEDNKYDVTFNFYKEVIDENGESSYVLFDSKSDKAYEGETVEVSAVDAPAAYYVYVGTTATETENGFSAVVSTDKENVYDVTFDLERYTVTYYRESGSVYSETKEIPYGTTVDVINHGPGKATVYNNTEADGIAATMTAYTFAKWQLEDTDTFFKKNETIVVTSDMDLYPVYSERILGTWFAILNPELTQPAGTDPEPVKNYTNKVTGAIDYFTAPGSTDLAYVYGTIMEYPVLEGMLYTNTNGEKVNLTLADNEYVKWYVVKDEADGYHVDGVIMSLPKVTYVLDGETIKTEYVQIDSTEAEPYDFDCDEYVLDGSPVADGGFTGWMLEGEVVTSIKDLAEDVTVYGYSIYTTTVKYVYEDGTKAAESVVKSGRIGAEFASVVSPSIEDYTASVAEVAAEDMTIVKGGKVITVVYTENEKSSLTINYVYKNGATAADSVVLVNYVGKKASDKAVNSPVINKYVADKTVVAADEIEITDEPQVINVVYTKNVYGVTINYVFAEGEELEGAVLPETVGYEVEVGKATVADTALLSVDVTGCDITGVSEYEAEMPAEDVVITVEYSVKRFDVVYLVNGVEVDIIKVTYGTDVSSMLDAEYTVAEGYTFSGWSTDAEGKIVENIEIIGSTTRAPEVEADEDIEIIDPERPLDPPGRDPEVEADTDASDKLASNMGVYLTLLGLSGVAVLAALKKRKVED